ncbi:hypothetical protein D9619_013305 [Psilocybe cf. subviscida]|uniref:Uncharacterized protein n=1 Tax=Psilocybe cf. subviscida TaxID=2480587 RepID=A0A8H5BSC2_9AGAR|nr:hypothetical protein D9619_013305 [Psilocybe cf. subviscida]
MSTASPVSTLRSRDTPTGVHSSDIALEHTTENQTWNAGTITACVVGTVVALVLIIMLLLLLFRKRRQHAQLLGIIEGGSQPGRGDSSMRRANIDPFPSIRPHTSTPSSQCSATDSKSMFQKESTHNEVQHQVDLILLPTPLPRNPKHGHSQTSNVSLSPMPELTIPKRARLQITDERNTPPAPNTNSSLSWHTLIETLSTSGPQSAQRTGPPPTLSVGSPPSAPIRSSSQERIAMAAVQDEDSGLRLIQEGDTGGFVEVLPPSYTAQ